MIILRRRLGSPHDYSDTFSTGPKSKVIMVRGTILKLMYSYGSLDVCVRMPVSKSNISILFFCVRYLLSYAIKISVYLISSPLKKDIASTKHMHILFSCIWCCLTSSVQRAKNKNGNCSEERSNQPNVSSICSSFKLCFLLSFLELISSENTEGLREPQPRSVNTRG